MAPEAPASAPVSPSAGPLQAVGRLPTLTEVVLVPVADGGMVPVPRPAVAAPALDPGALAEQVLRELQPRIDALLEARLREALAPALARAADGLIRDTRRELAAAVRELVDQTVAAVLRQPLDRP